MNPVEKITRLHKSTPRTAEPLRVRMIVSENGAAGFDSEVLPDGRDETLVIAQLRGESCAEAVGRALARIASLERKGRSIESATLLLAADRDAERLAWRRVMTRALVSHMASSRRGELVLSTEEIEDDSAQNELFELATELDQEFGHSGVNVKLRLRPARSSPVATGGVPVRSAAGGAAA